MSVLVRYDAGNAIERSDGWFVAADEAWELISTLSAALEDCLADLEYLARAKDSDYARPDDITIERARDALKAARGGA